MLDMFWTFLSEQFQVSLKLLSLYQWEGNMLCQALMS